MFKTNLEGLIIAYSLALQAMKENHIDDGHIINISIVWQVTFQLQKLLKCVTKKPQISRTSLNRGVKLLNIRSN